MIGAGLFWVGSWIVLSGGAQRTKEWAHEKTVTFTADKGFTVSNILVEGRHYTDPDAVLAILNIKKGDPVFSFDPAPAQDMLNKLSWVKEARVQRRLPDTIYVELTERKPMALWQHEGKVKVIDEEGAVLTSDKLERFRDLLIVTGENAPEQAHVVIEALEFEPDIAKRAESAAFISDRRWDLMLVGGIRVKLPEEEIGFALRRLAGAHDESGLLDKDIKSIDLREDERIIVQTRPGAVQDYRATFEPAAGNPI